MLNIFQHLQGLQKHQIMFGNKNYKEKSEFFRSFLILINGFSSQFSFFIIIFPSPNWNSLFQPLHPATSLSLLIPPSTPPPVLEVPSLLSSITVSSLCHLSGDINTTFTRRRGLVPSLVPHKGTRGNSRPQEGTTPAPAVLYSHGAGLGNKAAFFYGLDLSFFFHTFIHSFLHFSLSLPLSPSLSLALLFLSLSLPLSLPLSLLPVLQPRISGPLVIVDDLPCGRCEILLVQRVMIRSTWVTQSLVLISQSQH